MYFKIFLFLTISLFISGCSTKSISKENISSFKKIGILPLLRNDIKVYDMKKGFINIDVANWELNNTFSKKYSKYLKEQVSSDILILDNKELYIGYKYLHSGLDRFYYDDSIKENIKEIIRKNNLDVIIIITRSQVTANSSLNPVSIGLGQGKFMGEFTNVFVYLLYHAYSLKDNKLSLEGESDRVTVDKINGHLWNYDNIFNNNELSYMKISIDKYLDDSMKNSFIDMGFYIE